MPCVLLFLLAPWTAAQDLIDSGSEPPPGARHPGEVAIERFADEIFGAARDPLAVQINNDEKQALSIAERMLPNLTYVLTQKTWNEAARWFTPEARVALPAWEMTRDATLPCGAREADWRVPEGAAQQEMPWQEALAQARSWFGTWKAVQTCSSKVVRIRVLEPWARVEAQLGFEIVGVGPDGLPTQLQLRAGAVLLYAEGNWRLERFAPFPLRRTQGEAGWFTPQTRAAGLSGPFPAAKPTDGRRAGIAVGDFDGDGWQDVFVGHVLGGYLYRNRGNGTFEDVTRPSELPRIPCKACLWIDYDADGDLDLVLGRHAPPGSDYPAVALFRNEAGRFAEVTREALPALAGPVSALAAADFDGDGVLDLLVTQTGTMTTFSFDRKNKGTENYLLLGSVGGAFRRVPLPGGERVTRWSHAAAVGDANGDGRADAYVSNDSGQMGEFYLSQPEGGWRDAGEEAGVGNESSGMGVSWGDFDGDGDLDLYVTNMTSTAGTRVIVSHEQARAATGPGFDLEKMKGGNRLFRNEGGGRFTDLPGAAGAGGGKFCWAGEFLDFDNDGWLDIYCTNGFVTGPLATDW